METASELIERPLPPLIRLGGTTYPSIPTETISARFIHEWQNFESEVLEACDSLDLSRKLSSTDETEDWRLGSELGLTGRFAKHVGDAVTKALSVTELAGVKFGDYQCVEPYDASKVPDMILLELPEVALLVGEMKTYWTLPLERYPVRQGLPALVPLQPHLGKFSCTSNQTTRGITTLCKPVGLLHAFREVEIWFSFHLQVHHFHEESRALQIRDIHAYFRYVYQSICPSMFCGNGQICVSRSAIHRTCGLLSRTCKFFNKHITIH